MINFLLSISNDGVCSFCYALRNTIPQQDISTHIIPGVMLIYRCVVKYVHQDAALIGQLRTLYISLTDRSVSSLVTFVLSCVHVNGIDGYQVRIMRITHRVRRVGGQLVLPNNIKGWWRVLTIVSKWSVQCRMYRGHTNIPVVRGK